MNTHRALRRDPPSRHRVIPIQFGRVARATRGRLPCGYWRGLSLTAVGISREEDAT